MIDNGNWTRVKCNLVINHKHDFSAKCEFDLKSQVIFQTKIARHEVQLITTLLQPLWNRWIQPVPNFIDLVVGLFKNGRKKAVSSHFDATIEQKCCNLEQKWCDLEEKDAI